MKLPQSVIDGAIQIGSKKYALFSAITLIDAEAVENDKVGMTYREGEIVTITDSTDDSPAEYCMETSEVFPVHVKANSVEDAVERFKIELTALVARILETEFDDALESAVIPDEDCCGGGCHTETPTDDEKA